MKRYTVIMAAGILALAQALGPGAAAQTAVQHALAAAPRPAQHLLAINPCCDRGAPVAVGPIDGGPSH